MPTWHIVFKVGAQNNLRTKKRVYDAAPFDATAKANEFDGHEVIGMWAINNDTPNADVIRKQGRVSEDIGTRFNGRS